MHDCAQDVKPWVQELRTAYSSRKNTVAERLSGWGPRQLPAEPLRDKLPRDLH